MSQLIGSQVGKYSGPILVIGGAPSVPEELKILKDTGFDFETCLIVSANEHAIHTPYKPHFAVVNDDIHQILRVRQEPRMRRLMPGTKLVSRHWWADYRSPQLMSCNSGLKSLLYAALLGGNPIVVVGIQHYQDGLYFHKVEDHPGWGSHTNLGRPLGHFSRRVQELSELLRGVPVRPVAGPLTQVWPAWRADEEFAPRGLCGLEQVAAADAATARRLESVDVGAVWYNSVVAKGVSFEVTAEEARAVRGELGFVDVTDTPLDDAMRARQEAARKEQARIASLIDRARSAPRAVRRGIYDSDLARIIELAETQRTPLQISKDMGGLPPEQVKYLLKVMGLAQC